MPGFNVGMAPSFKEDGAFFSHRWLVDKLGPILGSKLRSVKSCQFPNLSFEVDNIQGASVMYKIAKVANWEPVTITFYDINGLHDDLKEWSDKVWTVDGGIRPINEYADTTRMALEDNQGIPVFQQTLENSWPQNIAHGPLSYDSSDLKELTVTIEYSWAT